MPRSTTTGAGLLAGCLLAAGGFLCLGTDALAADPAGVSTPHRAGPSVHTLPVGGTTQVHTAHDARLRYRSTTPHICTVHGNTVTGLLTGTCILVATRTGGGHVTKRIAVTQGSAAVAAPSHVPAPATPETPAEEGKTASPAQTAASPRSSDEDKTAPPAQTAASPRSAEEGQIVPPAQTTATPTTVPPATGGVGVVTNTSGPLFATTANGAQRSLAPHSSVHAGDTLTTPETTYARIQFADNGEITLRPNTQFKVEEFHYNAKEPEQSSAFFNLLKGGLRAISGIIGKSGNHDRYRMNAASATIGIRGTIYGATLCQGGSCGASIPEGLHVDVSQGAIVVSNPSGTQQVNTGQFGYVQNANAKPVLLPANPGVKFNPPPALTIGTHSGAAGGGGGPSMGGGGCEVH